MKVDFKPFFVLVLVLPACAAIKNEVLMSFQNDPVSAPQRVVIIGGGPAGLMAAEALSSAGANLGVRVFDAMPSVGRKFLLARAA